MIRRSFSFRLFYCVCVFVCFCILGRWFKHIMAWGCDSGSIRLRCVRLFLCVPMNLTECVLFMCLDTALRLSALSQLTLLCRPGSTDTLLRLSEPLFPWLSLLPRWKQMWLLGLIVTTKWRLNLRSEELAGGDNKNALWNGSSEWREIHNG